jgi:hypothetical protein
MYIYTCIYICIYIHTSHNIYMLHIPQCIYNGPGISSSMMMFPYVNYNERVSQNLYTIRFHTDQPKRRKYKKILVIIRNKGSMIHI